LRLVFAHPADPGLVIKVIRPDLIDGHRGAGQPWYKARRRYGRYSSYMREIGEYVAIHARYGKSLPFIEKTVGFAETDLGLGLVFEAVRDASGGLAPSLSDLLAQKRYTPEVAENLEHFISQLLESDVIIADLHPANIVYAENSPTRPHFVMIDGLGIYTLFPFKAVSRWLNRRSKLRHIARLRSRMVAWLPDEMKSTA
jgi:hypothetical protein